MPTGSHRALLPCGGQTWRTFAGTSRGCGPAEDIRVALEESASRSIIRGCAGGRHGGISCTTVDRGGGATSDVKKRFGTGRTPTISSGHSRRSRINTTGKLQWLEWTGRCLLSTSSRGFESCPEHQSRRSSMDEQRTPTPQARSSNLYVEPNTESYPGRAAGAPAKRAVPSRAWGSCPQLPAKRV